MSMKDASKRKQFYNSSSWLNIREQVLKRDNYECIWCKQEGKVSTSANQILEVDHIQELETHPELALELSNLRTLCNHHHNIRHDRFQKKFNKWEHDERWD